MLQSSASFDDMRQLCDEKEKQGVGIIKYKTILHIIELLHLTIVSEFILVFELLCFLNKTCVH